MTGNNQIRVDDNAVPTAQKFLSDQSALTAPHMMAQGVADGPAQQYLDTMNLVAARTRAHFQKQQQVLTADVQSILGSLQDLMETDSQAADLLKQFLADVNAIPNPSSPSTGTGAGGAAGAAGSTKEWD